VVKVAELEKTKGVQTAGDASPMGDSSKIDVKREKVQKRRRPVDSEWYGHHYARHLCCEWWCSLSFLVAAAFLADSLRSSGVRPVRHFFSRPLFALHTSLRNAAARRASSLAM